LAAQSNKLVIKNSVDLKSRSDSGCAWSKNPS
jgi:hypothetical protein